MTAYAQQSSNHALLVAAGMPARTATTALARLTTLAGVANATVAELITVGATPKQAARLLAAIEIGRRAVTRASEAPSRVATPEDIFALVRPHILGTCQEIFFMVAISVRNDVLGIVEVARGSLTGVEVHAREVFRPAIRLAAAGIVVAHNHPSGDPTPSPEDIELTKRLREAGALLGIPVIDHVVVTEHAFRSIADTGLL